MTSRMYQILAGFVAVYVFLTLTPSVSAQEYIRIVEPTGSCTDMDGNIHQYAARAHPRGPDGMPDLKTWQCATGMMESYGPIDQNGVYVKLDKTGFWQGKIAYDPSHEGWKYHVEATVTPVVTSTPTPLPTIAPTATPEPTSTPQPTATSVPQQAQFRTLACPDGSNRNEAESYFGYAKNDMAYAQTLYNADHCKVEAWICYWGANVAGHTLNEVNTNADAQSHADFGSKEAWLARAKEAGCFATPQSADQPRTTETAPEATATNVPAPAPTATQDPSIPYSVCYRDRDEYRPVVMSKWEYEENGYSIIKWQGKMMLEGCSPIFDHSTKPSEPEPEFVTALGGFGALFGYVGTGSLIAGVLVWIVGLIWTLIKAARMNTGAYAARFSIAGAAFGVWFVEGLFVALAFNAAPVNARAMTTLMGGAVCLGTILVSYAIFDTSVQKSGKNHPVLDVGGYAAVTTICWVVIWYIFAIAARDGIFK